MLLPDYIIYNVKTTYIVILEFVFWGFFSKTNISLNIQTKLMMTPFVSFLVRGEPSLRYYNLLLKR